MMLSMLVSGVGVASLIGGLVAIAAHSPSVTTPTLVFSTVVYRPEA
jgi:hypothetical protein